MIKTNVHQVFAEIFESFPGIKTAADKAMLDIHVEKFKTEIQNLNEIGGPDTIEDYIVVLQKVEVLVREAIEQAWAVKREEKGGAE